MGDGVIAPGSGGPVGDSTRKAVGGWHAIMEGRNAGKNPVDARKERILKENAEKAEAIRSGKPQKEEGFRPGEDNESDGFNIRRAREHMQKLNEQRQTQSVFKGNAQQIALKLMVLTEGDADIGAKGGKKVKVLGCEETGLGQYKLTYLLLAE